jgi:twitching motility two-component system response regulator PilG
LAAFLADIETTEYRDNFSACYQVGLAYLNLGRFDDALAALGDALLVRPNDRELRVLLTEVARLVRAGESLPETVGNRRAILVADSSGAVRKLVSMLLQEHGYRAHTAATGYEAVDLLRERGVPDLVLLDIDLPGLDGFQLCRLLRQNPDTADLPIVLLTSQDGFLARVRGRLAGATEHLGKPFERETLLRLVARHCQARQPAQTASETQA